MSSKYAPGTQAWGRCQRCSQKFYLRDLVFDGYMPGLRVCIDCYDPRHPQEFLQDTADPQGLWQPSPEFGPVGPTLSVASNPGSPATPASAVLTWTKADPAGGPRIINYTLTRAVSYDGGLNFQPFQPIYTAVVQYDAFGALLYEPDHPLDYTPYVPPGTTIIDPYTYTDTAIVIGPTYQYQVLAYITNHRNVPSNIVQTAQSLTLEYLTSRPYPYDFSDALKAGALMEPSVYANDSDAMKSGFFWESGTITSVLLTYSYYAPEPLKTAFVFESGTVFTGLVTYGNYAPEPMKTAFVFESGTVYTGLVTYSNYANEPMKTAFTFTAGTVA